MERLPLEMCFLSHICIRSVLSRQRNTQTPPLQWFLALRGLLSEKMSTWTLEGKLWIRTQGQAMQGQQNYSLAFPSSLWIFIDCFYNWESGQTASQLPWIKSESFQLSVTLGLREYAFSRTHSFLHTHTHTHSLLFRKTAERCGSIWSLKPLTSK